MTSFPGHQDLPEKPFTEQLDQFNPSFSPRHNYFTLSPPSFFVPEGLQDLLNQLLPISTTPPQSPLMPATQIPCVPLDTNIKANRNTKALQGLDISGHKRAVKKDRHSKIYTATGPRDRRMRLSLEVARKFFHLQDMLGFDKASKTVQWLLNVSDEAIKELAGVLQPKSFSRNSSCSTESYPSESEGASTVSDLKAKSSMLGITNVPETCKIKNRRTAIRTYRKANSNPMLQKETRAKARARARERTRDKKMMCPTSTPLASFDLTEASSSSHNDLYMKLANERVYGFEMGADGSELLTPIFDYGSYQNATSVNQAVNVLQEQWGLERLPLCQCTNQLQTLRGFQALTASHNCNY